MARAERQTGLVQVVVSLANLWGPNVRLPVEVRASGNGRALPCLTVAQTLDRLYGSRGDTDTRSEATKSFAHVSEEDDYRVPTNYKHLAAAAADSARSEMLPPLPAFASLPGAVYPGPAVLGDARALSGFLLQSEILTAGEPEHVGWIVFDGESLKSGGTLEISIDLGRGPRRMLFDVPAS
jgi:hypothetical protein